MMKMQLLIFTICVFSNYGISRAESVDFVSKVNYCNSQRPGQKSQSRMMYLNKSQCPGEAVINWRIANDNSGAIYVMARNSKDIARAYRFPVVPGDLKKGHSIKLDDPLLVESCGSPLVLSAVDDASGWKFTLAKVGSGEKRLKSGPVRTEDAVRIAADDLKQLLLEQGKKGGPEARSMELCYSGLQSLIVNFKLDPLGDAEKAAIQSKFLPPGGHDATGPDARVTY